MIKYQLIYLKDIADSQTGPFGSQLHKSDYVSEGTPMLTVEHLGIERFTHQNLPFVSDIDKKRLSKYILKEGDIVFSRVGSVDRCTYVTQEEDGWMFSGRCIRVRTNNNAIGRYLNFYFRQDKFKTMMLNISVGATMPSLNTTLMDNIPIRLPNINTQQKVAKVLSDLDDKIDLNNKINKELESLAKMLYDYWFVQFDFPYSPPSEGCPQDGVGIGKPYKSSDGLMVYNDELKREIPVGWEVQKIKDVIEVKDGTHDSPKQKNEGYRLITSKNLQVSGLDFENANFISEEDYLSIIKRSNVETGDILFSMIGNIGTIYKVEEENINFAIKNVALYKTSQKQEYKNFIYMFLKSIDMDRYMRNVISGSIQKFIGLNSLRNTPILINETLIKKYNESTHSIFVKLENLKLENQQLTELRDWLLPMLMNGQVTVGDAAAQLGMVAEPQEKYKN